MENISLPKIMLGTWSWGGGLYGGDQVFGNSISAKDVKEVFKVALENGLNAFDTATAYGLGASEAILGELMRDYNRTDLVISTKFTPQLAEMYDNSVEKMFNASAARFNTDYIDIYWIHNPSDVERWTSGLIPLLKAGKVKAVGVSNHNLAQIKRVNEILAPAGFKIDAVQNHFSLLYRASEDAGILDYCKQNGIVFFAYMTLEQGALSGKYSPENPMPIGSGRGDTYNKVLPQLVKLTDKMRAIGEKQAASVAQIAVAYAIAKGTVPILGATKLHHVTDAAKAMKLNLSADEAAELERLAKETGVDTRGAWENPMV
ncbi:aldo/keto reductase [Chelonobacter oris]|uniref:Aldo/keto reductase n=1 Tax=Chelonobacter oris TaxID=505317 RepID=A0A0A3ALD1_9PAST|nr:aldo/keto reductase [Chelonobacter oris]KGQ70163.1 aldo/keto reductase [Chelonobacter oris]